ncbi:hypothetical protein IQ06DRAFT_12130 [Phaeosphaeriaceae sp. SRC1lsM3a]|nr:hypothetical protein IQ06DRAFT_12130 [Stagonospora sp. SRC1lsM3a]
MHQAHLHIPSASPTTTPHLTMARIHWFKPNTPSSPPSTQRHSDYSSQAISHPPPPFYSPKHVRGAANIHFDVHNTYPPEHAIRMQRGRGQDQHIHIHTSDIKNRGFVPKSPPPQHVMTRIPNWVLWLWVAVCVLAVGPEGHVVIQVFKLYLAFWFLRGACMRWKAWNSFCAVMAMLWALGTGVLLQKEQCELEKAGKARRQANALQEVVGGVLAWIKSCRN